MTPVGSYTVTVQQGAPRAIAAVSARVTARRIPEMFRVYLDQVYAAARSGALHIDGQNIFVYRTVADLPEEIDVDFGVGITAPFAPTGSVRMVDLPTGEAAMTIHRGAYSGLGGAHAAVLAWCRTNGRSLAGTSWEIYGHWTENEAQLETTVCYLLAPTTR
ncbi:MAG TPA: GyrI-like domain-containing protein [Gemmatimonadaceae bacterium]|jgi:effector-binding domain-containing protein